MAGPFEAADFQRLIPEDKKLDLDWIASLTRRGTPETYVGEDLRFIGMPVGGLFCGTVYLGGDGRLWLWDIFNKMQLGIEPAGTIKDGEPINPIYGSSFVAPLEADRYRVLDQGFAITVKTAAGEMHRSLDSTANTGFRDVTFTGEYPIGVIHYADPTLPVSVKLEAFSPFIPLDVEASSLPATIFSFEVQNNSDEELEVSLEGSLENMVLCNHRFLEGTRQMETRDGEGITLVALSADPKVEKTDLRPDIPFEDWSDKSYADSSWEVEGDAFGLGPILRSNLPGYMGDVGGDTASVANSHAGSEVEDVAAADNAMGALRSRPFTIERKFIRFWIGGGEDLENLGVRLWVDDEVVRSATGKNSNTMRQASLEVAELQGREARLEIIDNKMGGWGNTGVGSIIFTDRLELSDEDMARLPDDGSMALGLIGAPAEIRHADAGVPLVERQVAGIGRRFQLAPGATTAVHFVLSWHFPHAPKALLGGREHAYASRFADAPAVLQFIAQNFQNLTGQTQLWRDTWYDSTLPFWFLNRVFANTSTLATTTCYYFSGGRFYAMEGVGCCPGTCTHVWHYAQSMARLFPVIEREHREQVDFGIAMAADGVIAYRGEDGAVYAVDGQAGRILGVYREHQMSADDAFLRRVWPQVKTALLRIIATDGDRDGLLHGPLHNTLDADWHGVVPWLCGMYHSALQAGEQMALEVGDADFATECREILKVAPAALDDLCWNPEFGYYIHVGDPALRSQVGAYEGCHIDQVLGQSWAWQVGLGEVMTREHVRTSLESLWKYNFTPDVGPFRAVKTQGRWYALPGDGGMIMLSSPFVPEGNFTGNGAWSAMYFNECMSGFEHQVAAHMLWEDMVMEGMAVTRAIHDRYNAARRNPYNEIECSDHYARAMASYGTFLAACGYEYHGPRMHMGFAPRLTPEKFQAAFTAAEGWGSYRQEFTGGRLLAELEVRWGRVRLKSFSLRLPAGAPHFNGLSAMVDGKPIETGIEQSEQRLLITFHQPVELIKNSALKIENT